MSLGAISNRIHYGYNASAKERGNAKLLRITDIQNGSVNWTSVPYCSLEDREIAKFRLAPGDIVIARTGGTIGKSFLIAEKLEELAVFASYLIRVIPDKLNVNPSYLLRFLDSPYYWEQLSDNSRGTGQPNVNAKALSGIKVPLPPIEEQLRIVAKISQLFGQIERAEKAYNELSGPLAERFRQLCLEKAIQGKLVPQLESEPEVKQIGEAPENVPFAIPEKWKWLTIKEITEKIIGGGTPSKGCADYWNGGIPWASVKDLKGDVLSNTKDHITQAGLDNSSSKLIQKGTIIICVRMGLGKISINSIDIAINQDLKAIFIKENIIDKKYFFFFYKSLSIKGSGSTVMGIKTKDLLSIPIPIPPLDEQRRIVAKLNKLLSSVAQIESSVSTL